MEDLSLKVDYNTGKFQSEVILKRSDTKGILFAFSQGQELQTHTAPVDVWLVMLEGECTFTIEEKKHTLKAGSITQIPATIPHSLKAITDFKMLLIR